MNPRLDLVLYLGVLATLGYLIYRYARYSRWEDTDAGRAFMCLKVCLLFLVAFALATRVDPGGEWIPGVRLLIVGFIWAAIAYQARVMVRRQGGFRRNRPVQRWVPYVSEDRREP